MSITFLVRSPRVLSVALVCGLVAVSGCEQAKTSNPLSPLIAGPIEGVDITVPRVLEPGSGWKVEDKNQPITLLIENPSSTSPRPYQLRVEVATDAAFANVVFAKSQLSPGPNGRTSLRLPDRLAPGRSYLWRTKAEDGANSSAWSAAAQFEVLMPIVIGTPIPKAPIGGVRTATRQPTLVAGNGVSTGPHAALFYHFQLSNSASFGDLTANAEAPESASGETSLPIPSPLPNNTALFWRVRITDGLNIGPWSRTESFTTPLPPVVPPTPPPPGPPPPPSGGWPTNGPDLAAFIAAQYPERLAPTGSLEERLGNTEFLRDRLIEAGICGGMDLALNLKRGGPEISIDFIGHRKDGVWHGIDFASASKVYTSTMSLYWGDNGPGAFPTPYPGTPNCTR